FQFLSIGRFPFPISTSNICPGKRWLNTNKPSPLGSRFGAVAPKASAPGASSKRTSSPHRGGGLDKLRQDYSYRGRPSCPTYPLICAAYSSPCPIGNAAPREIEGDVDDRAGKQPKGELRLARLGRRRDKEGPFQLEAWPCVQLAVPQPLCGATGAARHAKAR